MKYISALLSIWFFACSETHQRVPIVMEEVSLASDVELPGPERLSEWNLFKGDLKNLQPVHGMLPYELNTPLFSDYASKLRFVYMPEGSSASFRKHDVVDMPTGSILVKNFYYDTHQLVSGDQRRIMETRLLVLEEDEWKGLTYVWNDEQTEAFLEIAGTTRPLDIFKADGKQVALEYSVPNLVQCKSCHEKNGKMTPIGPTVRQLNREYPYNNQLTANQIDRWKSLGMLEGVPAGNLPKLPVWDDETTGSLNERARAWIEINCAHCHQLAGPAKNSGLYLEYAQTDKYRLGVNKPPVAAGRGSAGLKYGIVPGKPEESFMVHRIKSTDPGTMMPEVGRKLVHEEGVALVTEWISEMKP
ncbi:MAG: SO2930 family diheme c-type cytochrome [Cyclobacteriaceae bacterium]